MALKLYLTNNNIFKHELILLQTNKSILREYITRKHIVKKLLKLLSRQKDTDFKYKVKFPDPSDSYTGV